ncbi:MAG: ornithine carbamoyltransferase [Planctomycetota bacterium]
MLGKDFLSLRSLDSQDFVDLLTVAVWLKQRRLLGELETALAGKTLAMVFEKASLRTRVSFEVGMSELGGRAMYIAKDEVGLGSREPVQDVARVLSRYVQGIMIRTFAHNNVEQLAEHAGVPVINGLSDESHPCQALADYLTMLEHFDSLQGLTVVFIGDGNNVARSLARGALLCGADFVLACPEAYAFTKTDQQEFAAHWGKQIRQVHDPITAVTGADVLYSDVWTSMGQEAEKAERLRAFQGYQINDQLLAKASDRVRIMHCLPAHRGEEITDAAFESERSIIFDQAENRMHAQKAVMRLLLAEDRDEVIKAARAAMTE